MSARDPQPIALFELASAETERPRRTARKAPEPPPPAVRPEVSSTPVTSIAELPLLLSMIEAAALLRIGRTTVYKLAEAWRSIDGATGIPTVRVGTKLFVRRADLERIVNGPDEAA